MTDVGTSNTADLAALEAFVTENDDLFALEERIGRFNIFDALSIARAEIRHSNFLAWLLDPSASHGQGDLFLKALLMDLLRAARAADTVPPVSPVELDGADLHGTEVRREWKNIDLLIACAQPRFIVAIENKVDSGEHSGQLARYEQTVTREFLGHPALYVFLTPDGEEPSDEKWVAYSYGDLHRVLSRLRRTAAGALGSDVAVFLNHYLSLIGSRFMDDPALDALCKRIYANHRQALQLIWERVGSPASGVLGALEDSLASDGRWHVFNRTGRRIDFVPTAWLDWIPPICARPKQDPRFWVRLFLARWRAYRLVFEIGPATDKQLRRALITRLTQQGDEFGLRVQGKLTDNWTRLWSVTVAELEPEGEEPDAPAILETTMAKLHDFLNRTQHLPDAAHHVVRS